MAGIDGSRDLPVRRRFQLRRTANGQIGPNASQLNLYGYGIGSFNDRIRDGIRGGSPFTDERVQGFAWTLHRLQRLHQRQSALTQPISKAQLGLYSDWILVGLTGNLRDYTFSDHSGPPLQEPQSATTASPRIHQEPHRGHQLLLRPRQPGLFDAVQLKSIFSMTPSPSAPVARSWAWRSSLSVRAFPSSRLATTCPRGVCQKTTVVSSSV